MFLHFEMELGIGQNWGFGMKAFEIILAMLFVPIKLDILCQDMAICNSHLKIVFIAFFLLWYYA